MLHENEFFDVIMGIFAPSIMRIYEQESGNIAYNKGSVITVMLMGFMVVVVNLYV